MYDKNELFEKIRTLYPESGECSIDLDVGYDEEQNSWVVYLKKGNREVKHYLPDADADYCMEGKQCVSLGLEIAQFKD
jgi:hypothetical protein